jgi:hypothetical protein
MVSIQYLLIKDILTIEPGNNVSYKQPKKELMSVRRDRNVKKFKSTKT